jgi:hypothetical protein
LIFHPFEKVSIKHLGHTPKILFIKRIKDRVREFHFLLTLDKLRHGSPLAFRCYNLKASGITARAREGDLAKHQRKLTESIDCFHVWFIQQRATTRLEHTLKETLQKCRETTTMPFSSFEGWSIRRSDETLVQPFLDGLSKVRQGDS